LEWISFAFCNFSSYGSIGRSDIDYNRSRYDDDDDVDDGCHHNDDGDDDDDDDEDDHSGLPIDFKS
jgi:hypothetical protein